jgi:retinol-binding protein 3
VDRLVISEKFIISLPVGRAINPITQTNWEGVGVEPHIKVGREEALRTAQIKALESLSGKATGEAKKQYEWHFTSLKAKEQTTKLDDSQLSKYVGVYGPREITVESGRLFYQRSGSPKYELIPLDKDLFGIAELADFRVKFERENDQVKALTGIYLNGTEDTFHKED